MKLLAAAALPVLVTALSAQQPPPQWARALPGGSGAPAGRSWPGFAHDPLRGHSLLFGGYSTSSGYLQDTWTYDAGANAWRLQSPPLSPSARHGAGLAADPLRGVVVLFGGAVASLTPLGDLWEWNGTTWTQVTPVGTGPAARQDTAMAWFPVANKVFLYGGVNHYLNRAYADTWEWNGSSWNNAGSVPQPYMRSAAALAYDSLRARMVLFGGVTLQNNFPNDTWEHDGTAWAQTATGGPLPRRWHAMAFDPGLGAVVLHGGGQLLTRFDDTWTYNGAWTQLQPATTPGVRDGHRMVHDTAQGRLVMFGGYDGQDLGDTWWFGNALPGTWSSFGSGCAGSAGVPQLGATSAPTLGTSFGLQVQNLPVGGGLAVLVLGLDHTQWNGQPLPLPLAAIGLPGCQALCRPDATALLVHVAGTATWSAALPTNPALAGLHLYQQVLSLDPLAGNAFGGALSAGGDATLR